jgi:Lar family restriction alleviation protein
MMEIELKPCPFCGGKADFEYADQDDGMGRCECTKCGVGYFDDRESAIEKWNNRLIEALSEEENNRLSDLNNGIHQEYLAEDIEFLASIMLKIVNNTPTKEVHKSRPTEIDG